MSYDTITFELPTHDLPKIALHLESLLYTISQAAVECHPIIHKYALQNVIEILQFIQKPELKSRFLKEFMRMEHLINRPSASNISPECYSRLYAHIQVLNHVSGRFGEGMQNNPFLQSIRQVQSLHSKDCEEDSPQLLLWLASPAEQRQKDFMTWLQALRALQDTIAIYLSIIRQSAAFESIQMRNGFYQRPLPSRTSCHLVLIRMEKTFVPQMQIGYHGLSVRLLEPLTMKELTNTHTHLDLAICQI